MAQSCPVSNEEMGGLFDEALPDWTFLFPDDNSYLFQDDAASWDNDSPGFDLDALLAIPETDGFTADGLCWSLNTTTTAPSVHLDSSNPSSDSDLVEFTPESSIDIPARSKVDSTLPSDLQEACCVTNHQLAQEKKRKWKESVVVFSSDPNVEISTRKRTAFDERRRKEVAMHRRVGACVQCKLRRGSCNLGIPCDSCTKRAGSIDLGRALCTRQGLLAIRFDNVDLLDISHFQSILQQQDRFLIQGRRREMYLYWPNNVQSDSTNLLMKVQIQDITAVDRFEFLPAPVQLILDRRYKECLSYTVPDKFWAIAPETLPTLDDLLHSCTNLDDVRNAGPFSGLHKAFGVFAERYCEGDETQNLPLKNLMCKVLRTKRLFTLFRRAALLKSSPDDEKGEFVGTWIKSQLKQRIASGIVKLEANIFDELDRSLYGRDGIGKRNPLATWVCLWILVLAYKEQMAVIHFHYLYDTAQLQSMYGLAKHIYNTLTSIYSALYKTTSPLTFDWRKEEVFSEMLGGDPVLIQLFCDIKTEMYWFHAGKDQLFSEDALFKALVVENESKLMESHKKAAKRQGLL